jgi:hypothetical protein
MPEPYRGERARMTTAPASSVHGCRLCLRSCPRSCPVQTRLSRSRRLVTTFNPRNWRRERSPGPREAATTECARCSSNAPEASCADETRAVSPLSCGPRESRHDKQTYCRGGPRAQARRPLVRDDETPTPFPARPTQARRHRPGHVADTLRLHARKDSTRKANPPAKKRGGTRPEVECGVQAGRCRVPFYRMNRSPFEPHHAPRP